MSIRGKVMAAAAVMTLVGGVSAAGTLAAQAATPSCYQNCINLFSQKYGSPFILDVQLQRGRAGQPITLYRASNNDAGEDFIIFDKARVSGFASLGLVSATVAQHWGGTCAQVSTMTHKCVQHYPNDWAYQIEYAPDGVPSGLCVGVENPATDGTKVVLERCGSGGRTTWVVDANASLGNSNVPLINGSDTNVKDPYVLNFPGSSAPMNMPSPQLTTWQLQYYFGGGVFNNQLWSADFGPVQ